MREVLRICLKRIQMQDWHSIEKTRQPAITLILNHVGHSDSFNISIIKCRVMHANPPRDDAQGAQGPRRPEHPEHPEHQAQEEKDA